MAMGSFYHGYTYADTMSREATDYFLELTDVLTEGNCNCGLVKQLSSQGFGIS